MNFAIPQVAAHENLEKKIEGLIEVVKKMKSETHQKKKTTAKKRAPIDQEKTQGYCLKFIRDGKCSYGSSCKYIHDKSGTAPEEVVKYAKSF